MTFLLGPPYLRVQSPTANFRHKGVTDSRELQWKVMEGGKGRGLAGELWGGGGRKSEKRYSIPVCDPARLNIPMNRDNLKRKLGGRRNQL